MHFRLFGPLAILGLAVAASAASAESQVRTDDGVIAFFPEKSENAIIIRERIDEKELWAAGVRRNGMIRQVRITSRIGGRGAKPSLIRLRYPFGDASATWNMQVEREGDIVSLMLPWNGTLIGDIMDVNEGEDEAEQARSQLGTTATVNPKLPVLYSSGDSISLGYWPYLEGELHDTVNVYYQRELAKDMPELRIVNNGHAHLAYGILSGAYRNEQFQPDYILINFGLHMIRTHRNKVHEYGIWIEKFAALAREHNARIIWVTTTPYQQSFRPEQNKTIVQFNQAAREVAKRHGIPVVDLHAFVLDMVKQLSEDKVYTDGVHFTEDIKEKQAAFMAKRIREIIEEKRRV